MLEMFRERLQGPVAKGILGAVFLSFVVTGVGLQYMDQRAEPFVAKVNGDSITKSEFDRALERHKSMLQNQFGDAYKMLTASDEAKTRMRKDVLDRLINERLLGQMLSDSGFIYSLEQFKLDVIQMPEFQKDGKFSKEIYDSLLRQNNLVPKVFFESQQANKVRQQLLVGLQASAFSLAADIDLFYRLDRQSRDFSYLKLPLASLGKVDEPTETQLKAYFETHKAEFVLPEKVQIDYVELSSAELSRQIQVTDADRQKYYDEHKADFKAAEKLKPAHILIPLAADPTAAKVKAEDLLKQLQAGGDFAALAKANSADSSSAEKAGELDWVERGSAAKKSILGDEFDNAVLALTKVGQLSPVIKTKYGFHIIKLAAIEAPKQLALSEVSSLIQAELQRQQAENRYFELQSKLKEFSFQFPDSLDEVAAQTGLKVQTSEFFTRTGGSGISSNPAVFNAAFSAPVLLDKQNSDPIELEKSHQIVLRVKQHQAQRQQDVAEVREQLLVAVKNEQSRMKVKAEGERLLALQKDGKLTADELAKLSLTWTEVKALTRSAQSDLDSQIRNQVFRLTAPAAGKTTAGGLSLANGDYVLINLTRVELADPSKMTAEEREQQQALLSNRQVEQQLTALLATKRQQAEIELKDIE